MILRYKQFNFEIKYFEKLYSNLAPFDLDYQKS